ncbi:MAG TPA: gamma-glutamyltransferase [Micavibrio sp.]|nr:gamma-glutamyltransferase [Micavibrio sp.]
MGKSPVPANPEIATPLAPSGTKTAHGSRIMVVTANPEATRVGYEVLKGGGSAADAAVAVQLVLGLVEPQSSGIGGGGFALYYDKKTNQVYSFDGRETAPLAAGKYLFRGKDGKPMDFYDAAVGGRAVGVPGTLRLLEMLHKRFGAKPWRDLFSPAVALAETGFMVSPRLAAMIEHDAMKLRNFTPTLLYFFPDAATPVDAGGRLINPPYARVLRKVAIGGADAFYKGETAEAIAKAVQEDLENPGLLSPEDMANYKAIERKTICGPYRAYLVCTMGLPSSGGLMLLGALGILQNFNMADLGPSNPLSWHYIAEASRLMFADRNYYMADPHFVQSPGTLLIDPAYLKSRAAMISNSRSIEKVMPGTPAAWKQRKPAAEPVYPKPPGTTHFTIVDAAGNILSMTDSIEDSFGSRMYVDGFMLNNQLTDFSFVPEIDGVPVANRVEGGKRPRSTMTPVIMFAPDGKPALAIGSAGGSAIMGYVLQRIVAVVDWNQDIATAVAAPNLINRGQKIEFEVGASELAEPLRKFGHPAELSELNSGLTAIEWKDGLMNGAADPRREGTAMGE